MKHYKPFRDLENRNYNKYFRVIRELTATRGTLTDERITRV